MKKKLFSAALFLFGLFALFGYASASDIKMLQPAETVTYNEGLVVNATATIRDITIGDPAVGGVTRFNGSIINEGGPVVIADDFRVDGMIWRGPSKGAGDNQPLKVADDLNPALTDINNIGSGEFKWKDAYFSGDVYMGNLQGSGVIHPDNISSMNNPTAGQVLSYNGSNFQWMNGGDITAVNAGSGLAGGGNSGDISLDLSSNYLSGSAYDGRFVTKADPQWNQRTGYVTVAAGAFKPSSDTIQYNQSGYQLITATNGASYFAPVQLPHNSTVTRVDYYWYDANATYNTTLNLYRINNGYTGTGSQMNLVGAVSSSGSSGWNNSYSTSMNYNNIDNGSYTYYLQAILLRSDTWIRSARITYTYTEPY